jgi:hypothetical protein
VELGTEREGVLVITKDKKEKGRERKHKMGGIVVVMMMVVMPVMMI